MGVKRLIYQKSVFLLIIIMSNLGKKYTKISILIKVFIKNVQKKYCFFDLKVLLYEIAKQYVIGCYT